MGIFPRLELESATRSGKGFIFYDPIDDGMEYIYLQWDDIDRTKMERLIGKPFKPDDFVSMFSEESIDYPATWGVMF
jgi:hypothetical protein